MWAVSCDLQPCQSRRVGQSWKSKEQFVAIILQIILNLAIRRTSQLVTLIVGIQFSLSCIEEVSSNQEVRISLPAHHWAQSVTMFMKVCYLRHIPAIQTIPEGRGEK